MTPPRLRVLVVAAYAADAVFAQGVLEDHGDSVSVATDVSDALSQLTKEVFDVALVSLSLPRGDGLALVHHVRALYPGVDVVVMVAPTELEESAHAMALGVLQTVLQPLTGDALLVAADRTRERRLLVSERARLAAESASSRRRTATYARCAAFVAETEAATIATRVLDACAAEVPTTACAIYVPSSPGSELLARAATLGLADTLPPELDGDDLSELDPTLSVHQDHGVVRVVLLGTVDVAGVILLACDEPVGEAAQEALEVVAALGTAAFSAARKVDAIGRAGIKDPDTSAYTFAYFGDVAGREIDRAARHGRRFALLTLGLDGVEGLRAGLPMTTLLRLRRSLTDAVLDAVRDSDVLARVEDDEFYLLLPETGLLGALAARRRIRAKLAGLWELSTLVPGAELSPVVGIAVYPTDGSDLGRLLRVSRRRSERSRRGVWRRLGLAGRPFWESVDQLIGGEDDAVLGRDGTVALHDDLVRAHDDLGLARHAPASGPLLARIAATLTEDAVRHRVAGSIYVAGSEDLVQVVARAAGSEERTPVRVWVLGQGEGPGSRLRLPVIDERLEERTFLLSLTELGGYVMLARDLGRGLRLAYHASDIFLVDELVASLQAAYHLQPEIGL